MFLPAPCCPWRKEHWVFSFLQIKRTPTLDRVHLKEAGCRHEVILIPPLHPIQPRPAGAPPPEEARPFSLSPLWHQLRPQLFLGLQGLLLHGLWPPGLRRGLWRGPVPVAHALQPAPARPLREQWSGEERAGWVRGAHTQSQKNMLLVTEAAHSPLHSDL